MEGHLLCKYINQKHRLPPASSFSERTGTGCWFDCACVRQCVSLRLEQRLDRSKICRSANGTPDSKQQHSRTGSPKENKSRGVVVNMERMMGSGRACVLCVSLLLALHSKRACICISFYFSSDKCEIIFIHAFTQ